MEPQESVLALEPLSSPAEPKTSAWYGLAGTVAGLLLSSQMASHLQLSSLPSPLLPPYPPSSFRSSSSSSPHLHSSGPQSWAAPENLLGSGVAGQANSAWQERATPQRGRRSRDSQIGSIQAHFSPHCSPSVLKHSGLGRRRLSVHQAIH